MQAALRIALSLWLNAYENALIADQLPTPELQLAAMKRAVAELSDASAELHRVADPLVEAAESGQDQPDSATPAAPKPRPPAKAAPSAPTFVSDSRMIHLKHRYAYPPTFKPDSAIRAMANWHEARSVIEDGERPTNDEYHDYEVAEAEMARIVNICRRYAEDNKFYEPEAQPSGP